MNPKQRAAEAALEFITDGTIVGLGTGSTADEFLRALGAAMRHGRFTHIRGIPTSRQSELRARELGIALTTLAESPLCDVTIDGADEVAPNLDLIKGLGGALLREKVVAQNSRKLIIIADAGKVVTKLGSKSALPVEVTQFAHEAQAKFLHHLGASPALRVGSAGNPFVTDNGNFIYDCRFANGIDDPSKLQDHLSNRAGIVEHGLFLGIAQTALVADEDSVQRIVRSQ